jgi:hypothetical protein
MNDLTLEAVMKNQAFSFISQCLLLFIIIQMMFQEFCFFFKKKLWMEMLKFYIIAETKESK